MKEKDKVFGIGLHKTATTSLAVALYVLGYNVTGYFGVNDPKFAENVHEQAYDFADRFDAAQDTPWPFLYKELDKRYPGSKFILTVRPTESWIRSVTKHFKSHYIPAHAWFYGVKTAVGNEDVYIQRYKKHNQEVKAYFKDRPEDLLVMDLTRGDGWERLCAFLGVETPPFDFPRQNTAKQKNRQLIQRGIGFLKRKAKAIVLDNYKNNQEADTMNEGVSSMFLRDLVHFHYAVYEGLWQTVNNLDDVQFETSLGYGEQSIAKLLTEQIEEEGYWLHLLAEDEPVTDQLQWPHMPTSSNKEALFQRWHEQMRLMRLSVARLTDVTCNGRIGAENVYTWEALMQVVTAGVERRTQIQNLLKARDITIDLPSFMGFFRSEPEIKSYF